MKISIADITLKQAQVLNDLAHALGMVASLNVEEEFLQLGLIFHCFNAVEKANFSEPEILGNALGLIGGEYTFGEKIEKSEFGEAAYKLLSYRLNALVKTKKLVETEDLLKASKKLRAMEDRVERAQTLGRIIDAEKRKRSLEDRSAIFKIWLKALLPEAKANLVHSELWDDADDARFKGFKIRTGVQSGKKVDTELNAFQLRLEEALGLKWKTKNGEGSVIELFPENGDRPTKVVNKTKRKRGHTLADVSYIPQGLSKLVKDYGVKKRFEGGAKPLALYQGFAKDVLLSGLRDSAINLLESRINGTTIFEGGVDSEPGKIALDLLWQRLRMATPQEDVHHIYLSWSHAVVQQDFMSNERSGGTIRTARKKN